MRRVHRYGDPAAAWLKSGWDRFISCSQSALSSLGCIKCASQFRRLTCGTCCEKRKAGKPKLYTNAMMELMLPESRHQRSASEHLLQTADFARRHAEEDGESNKFDISVTSPPAKVLKPALKVSEDSKPSKPRKMTVDEKQALASPDKPSKPRKLTVDERQAVVDFTAAEAAGSRRTTEVGGGSRRVTEDKKGGESPPVVRQADAAASLTAKMAAKLALRGTSAAATTAATSTTTSSSSTSSSSSSTSSSSNTQDDDVTVVPPEARTLTKSVAEGRPAKPAKPGRRSTAATSPTQL